MPIIDLRRCKKGDALLCRDGTARIFIEKICLSTITIFVVQIPGDIEYMYTRTFNGIHPTSRNRQGDIVNSENGIFAPTRTPKRKKI